MARPTTARSLSSPRLRRSAPLRREAVIAAAAEVFRTKGYAAATMRDIAERLGVTSAALYYHVRRKADLLYAICDQALTTAEQLQAQALAEPLPPAEQLARVVECHALAVLTESPVGMAVFFQEEGWLPPATRRAIAARRRRYEGAFLATFERAAAAGILAVPDVRLAAHGVLGLCNWAHRWYRPNRALPPAVVAACLARQALYGLLARPLAPSEAGRAGAAAGPEGQ